MGPRLKVSSGRLMKQGFKPATPGLQDNRIIYYITAAPPTLDSMRLRKHYFQMRQFPNLLGFPVICECGIHLVTAQISDC